MLIILVLYYLLLPRREQTEALERFDDSDTDMPIPQISDNSSSFILRTHL